MHEGRDFVDELLPVYLEHREQSFTNHSPYPSSGKRLLKPLILVFNTQRKAEFCELEAGLVYTVGSRLDKVTILRPCLKNKQTHQNQPINQTTTKIKL